MISEIETKIKTLRSKMKQCTPKRTICKKLPPKTKRIFVFCDMKKYRAELDSLQISLRKIRANHKMPKTTKKKLITDIEGQIKTFRSKMKQCAPKKVVTKTKCKELPPKTKRVYVFCDMKKYKREIEGLQLSLWKTKANGNLLKETREERISEIDRKIKTLRSKMKQCTPKETMCKKLPPKTKRIYVFCDMKKYKREIEGLQTSLRKTISNKKMLKEPKKKMISEIGRKIKTLNSKMKQCTSKKVVTRPCTIKTLKKVLHKEAMKISHPRAGCSIILKLKQVRKSVKQLQEKLWNRSSMLNKAVTKHGEKKKELAKAIRHLRIKIHKQKSFIRNLKKKPEYKLCAIHLLQKVVHRKVCKLQPELLKLKNIIKHLHVQLRKKTNVIKVIKKTRKPSTGIVIEHGKKTLSCKRKSPKLIKVIKNLKVELRRQKHLTRKLRTEFVTKPCTKQQIKTAVHKKIVKIQHLKSGCRIILHVRKIRKAIKDLQIKLREGTSLMKGMEQRRSKKQPILMQCNLKKYSTMIKKIQLHLRQLRKSEKTFGVDYTTQVAQMETKKLNVLREMRKCSPKKLIMVRRNRPGVIILTPHELLRKINHLKKELHKKKTFLLHLKRSPMYTVCATHQHRKVVYKKTCKIPQEMKILRNTIRHLHMQLRMREFNIPTKKVVKHNKTKKRLLVQIRKAQGCLAPRKAQEWLLEKPMLHQRFKLDELKKKMRRLSMKLKNRKKAIRNLELKKPTKSVVQKSQLENLRKTVLALKIKDLKRKIRGSKKTIQHLQTKIRLARKKESNRMEACRIIQRNTLNMLLAHKVIIKKERPHVIKVKGRCKEVKPKIMLTKELKVLLKENRRLTKLLLNKKKPGKTHFIVTTKEGKEQKVSKHVVNLMKVIKRLRIRLKKQHKVDCRKVVRTKVTHKEISKFKHENVPEKPILKEQHKCNKIINHLKIKLHNKRTIIKMLLTVAKKHIPVTNIRKVLKKITIHEKHGLHKCEKHVSSTRIRNFKRIINKLKLQLKIHQERRKIQEIRIKKMRKNLIMKLRKELRTPVTKKVKKSILIKELLKPHFHKCKLLTQEIKRLKVALKRRQNIIKKVTHFLKKPSTKEGNLKPCKKIIVHKNVRVTHHIRKLRMKIKSLVSKIRHIRLHRKTGLRKLCNVQIANMKKRLTIKLKREMRHILKVPKIVHHEMHFKHKIVKPTIKHRLNLLIEENRRLRNLLVKKTIKNVVVTKPTRKPITKHVHEEKVTQRLTFKQHKGCKIPEELLSLKTTIERLKMKLKRSKNTIKKYRIARTIIKHAPHILNVKHIKKITKCLQPKEKPSFIVQNHKRLQSVIYQLRRQLDQKAKLIRRFKYAVAKQKHVPIVVQKLIKTMVTQKVPMTKTDKHVIIHHVTKCTKMINHLKFKLKEQKLRRKIQLAKLRRKLIRLNKVVKKVAPWKVHVTKERKPHNIKLQKMDWLLTKIKHLKKELRKRKNLILKLTRQKRRLITQVKHKTVIHKKVTMWCKVPMKIEQLLKLIRHFNLSLKKEVGDTIRKFTKLQIARLRRRLGALKRTKLSPMCEMQKLLILREWKQPAVKRKYKTVYKISKECKRLAKENRNLRKEILVQKTLLKKIIVRTKKRLPITHIVKKVKLIEHKIRHHIMKTKTQCTAKQKKITRLMHLIRHLRKTVRTSRTLIRYLQEIKPEHVPGATVVKKLTHMEEPKGYLIRQVPLVNKLRREIHVLKIKLKEQKNRVHRLQIIRQPRPERKHVTFKVHKERKPALEILQYRLTCRERILLKKVKLIRKLHVARKSGRPLAKILKELRHLKVLKEQCERKRQPEWKAHLSNNLRVCRYKIQKLQRVIRRLKHLTKPTARPCLAHKVRKELRLLRRIKTLIGGNRKNIPAFTILRKVKHLKMQEVHKKKVMKQMKIRKVKLLNKLKLAKIQKRPTVRILKKLRHLEVKKACLVSPNERRLKTRNLAQRSKITLLEDRLKFMLRNEQNVRERHLKNVENIRKKLMHQVKKRVRCQVLRQMETESKKKLMQKFQLMVKEIKQLRQHRTLIRHLKITKHKKTPVPSIFKTTITVPGERTKLVPRQIIELKQIVRKLEKKLQRRKIKVKKLKFNLRNRKMKYKKLKLIYRAMMHEMKKLRIHKEAPRTKIIKQILLKNRQQLPLIQRLRIEKMPAKARRTCKRLIWKGQKLLKNLREENKELRQKLRVGKKKCIRTMIKKRIQLIGQGIKKHKNIYMIHRKILLKKRTLKLLRKLKLARKMKKPTMHIINQLRQLRLRNVHPTVISQGHKMAKTLAIVRRLRTQIKTLRRKLQHALVSRKGQKQCRLTRAETVRIRREVNERLQRRYKKLLTTFRKRLQISDRRIRLLKKLVVLRRKGKETTRIIKKLKHVQRKLKPLTILSIGGRKEFNILKKPKLVVKPKKQILRILQHVHPEHKKLEINEHIKLIHRRIQRTKLLKKLRIAKKEKKPELLKALRRLVQKERILRIQRRQIQKMARQIRLMRKHMVLMKKQFKRQNILTIKRLQQQQLKRKLMRKVVLLRKQRKPKEKIMKVIRRLKTLSRKTVTKRLTLEQRKKLTTKLFHELRLAKKENRPTTHIIRRLERLTVETPPVRQTKVIRIQKHRKFKTITEGPEYNIFGETPEELKRPVDEGVELKKPHDEGIELKKPYELQELQLVGRDVLYMTRFKTREEIVVYETAYSCHHGYKLRFLSKTNAICYTHTYKCTKGYVLHKDPGHVLCHKKIPRCSKGYDLQKIPGQLTMCHRSHRTCPFGYKLIPNGRGALCVKTVKKCKVGYLKETDGKPICLKRYPKCHEGYTLVPKTAHTSECQRRVPVCDEDFELRRTDDGTECVRDVPACGEGFQMRDRQDGSPVCTRTVTKRSCDEGFKKREKDGRKVCIKVVLTCLPGFTLKEEAGKEALCRKLIIEVPEESRDTNPNQTPGKPRKVWQTIPALAQEFPEVRECITVEKEITRPVEYIKDRMAPRQVVEFVPPSHDEISTQPEERTLRRRPLDVREDVKPIYEDRTLQPITKEVTMPANVVRKPVFGREAVVMSHRSPRATVRSLARFRKVNECPRGYRVMSYRGRKECVRCPEGFTAQQRSGYLACFKTKINCVKGYHPSWKDGKGQCIKEVYKCDHGFELTEERGTTFCFKRAPEECDGPRASSACRKTIHSCPAGYVLSKKEDLVVCVKKITTCTDGYMMKKKEKDFVCVKTVQTCDDGFKLSGEGEPTCVKKASKCTDGYEIRDMGDRNVCVKTVYNCPDGYQLSENGKTCKTVSQGITDQQDEIPASTVETTLQPEGKTEQAKPRLVEINTEPVKRNVDKVPATIRTIRVQDETRKPKVIKINVSPSTETVELPIEIVSPKLNRPGHRRLPAERFRPRLYSAMSPFLEPGTQYGTPVPLNVVFVIDNSADIRRIEFEYIQRFLNRIVYNPHHSWKIVRFGVITTANKPEVVFGLSPTSRARQLLPRLRQVGGLSNLDGALDLVSNVFSVPSKRAKRVAIVLCANSPSNRRTSLPSWNNLLRRGVLTLTISAGRGPEPPFNSYLKRSRTSDALLLPSFNILPSYPWQMRRGVQRRNGTPLTTPKDPGASKSFVTAFTCRPGYILRYERGRRPLCFKKVEKLLRCPNGYDFAGKKYVTCVRRLKTCSEDYKLRSSGDRSVCVKKVATCPGKYQLETLKDGDVVCLEKVHKCDEGYSLRRVGKSKTECVKTLFTCHQGYELERRTDGNVVCVKQVTERNCEAGYKLRERNGVKVCVSQTGRHTTEDSNGVKVLPSEEAPITIEKRISRPANQRLFTRGSKEAVAILKPSHDVLVKEPGFRLETKDPEEVTEGDERGGHVVRQAVTVNIGVTVLSRPVKGRTRVNRGRSAPVEVVLLGKKRQVMPKSGRILKCADGFQLQTPKGQEATCVRRCTVATCYKTVHKCPDGYTFDVKSDSCIRNVYKCTKGYRLKTDGSENTCVKAISACDDGYHLDSSGKRCVKDVPLCPGDYELRTNGAGNDCVKKIYSCSEGFKLKTKDGRKVCSMKDNVLTCEAGYKLIKNAGVKPHCSKLQKSGDVLEELEAPSEKEPTVMAIEKDKRAPFIEVTVQPERTKKHSQPRPVQVKTVPIQTTVDRTAPLVTTAQSDFETTEPVAISVDTELMNATKRERPLERHWEAPRQSTASAPLWYLSDKKPRRTPRVLNMTLEEFHKRYGKKQRVDFEQQPYHWVPLELHRPRSEGSAGGETHHKGPWYMFSTHDNGGNFSNDRGDGIQDSYN